MTTSYASAASAASATNELYRDSLQDCLITALITAARLGWTPADLRHLAGSGVDAYVLLAHDVVAVDTATTHSKVRAAWSRQISAAAGAPERLSVADLETVVDRLAHLPPLRDASTLTDLDVLTHLREDDGNVSVEQRRALQRITGLLKKAESTTFPAEAETLVAKAQQLRQRYRIETSDQESEVGDVVSVRVQLCAPWVKQQFLLLANVAVANACRSVLTSSVGIATLIGHPDDVRHTAELFASLNHQRDYFLRHSPGAQSAARSGQTASYRRSFQMSYARRIGDLLTDAVQDVPVSTHEATCALPVLANREVASEEAVDRIFPRTSGLNFTHGHHYGGAADGVWAADRSSLGEVKEGIARA